jgi:hypothetical protein
LVVNPEGKFVKALYGYQPPEKLLLFKTDVLPILQDSCALESGCHVGNMAAAGLRLDGPHPYAALVNAPSSLSPTWVRVMSGRPDKSVLWLKLTGKHKQAGIFGDPMPLDKPLPPSDDAGDRALDPPGSAAVRARAGQAIGKVRVRTRNRSSAITQR